MRPTAPAEFDAFALQNSPGLRVSPRTFGKVHVSGMKTKLTLSVDAKVKRSARLLSRKRKRSISALVSEFIERELARKEEPLKEFWGIWADRDITLEKIREKAWRRS